MSLKVRLQGLPPLADSIHIENFFSGLKIPPGGVNIIGGVHGEAFVEFKNKHAVSLALKRSGRLLMDSPIFISRENKSELWPKQNSHMTKFQHNPAYLRISFEPLHSKFVDVKSFFKGLAVKSVIFLTRNKVRTGEALVKFGKMGHLQKILSTFHLPKNKNSRKRRKKQDAFSVLSVKKSHEKEWVSCGGKIEPSPNKKKEIYSSYKWLPEMPSYDSHEVCIHEFFAHLLNVSLRAEKSHIRKFLYNLVGDCQITFLCDKNGSRQRECFVMFVTENDFVRALELDKAVLKRRRIRVLPISKENMLNLIEIKRQIVLGDPVSEDEGVKPAVKYLYLRNFAASVSKCDVLSFFHGFSLTEKDICLLYDDKGDSLGEALVRFSTKEEASKALKLNHKRFQDTEILLRRISEKQLRLFGVDCFLDCSTDNVDSSTKIELPRTGLCVSEVDNGV